MLSQQDESYDIHLTGYPLKRYPLREVWLYYYWPSDFKAKTTDGQFQLGGLSYIGTNPSLHCISKNDNNFAHYISQKRQCPLATWGEFFLYKFDYEMVILKYIWINMWSA